MATDPVDTSGEAIGRSITELMSWLTGPDSGQNDGLVTAANQLAALAKERDALDISIAAKEVAAQSALDEAWSERDAARADAVAAAAREQEARAEAGRLREALRSYAGGLGGCEWDGGARARAALAQEPRHD